MNLFQKLWQDEAGYILSAEAALVGTTAVGAAAVGLGAVSKSVNDELTEVAHSFRSLDQSYYIQGQSGPGAWTAGSGFIQQDVETSRADLGEWIEEQQHDADVPARNATDRAPLTAPSDEDARQKEFEIRRRRHEQERLEREQKQRTGQTQRNRDKAKKSEADQPKQR